MRLVALCALLLAGGAVLAAEHRVVRGLATPESVVIGPAGRILVSQIGEFGKDGDGSVVAVDARGGTRIFASGLDDPKGLAVRNNRVYVTDRTRIWRIDAGGKARVWVDAAAFPQPPLFLNDLAFGNNGDLFVSDSGELMAGGGKGAIYRITPRGKVSLVVNEQSDARIKSPNGLLTEGMRSLLVVDFATGQLLRVALRDGRVETLQDGFGGGDGLARDKAGKLYVSDWKGGQVWRVELSRKPVAVERYGIRFEASADIALDAKQKHLLVPDMRAGSLTWLPVSGPFAPR